MEVTIPEVPFAHLKGKSFSCKEIGGDFFDAVNTDEGLAVVLADVSSKGVPPRLASTLQGMIYSQLLAGMPLKEIVAAANRFFTHKHISEEYATLIVARLQRDGEMEYVNCGHVPPLLICNHEVIRPPHGNLPVGLLADATYESDHASLHAGDRLILVTHGVTDAENACGDFFGTRAWRPWLPRVRPWKTSSPRSPTSAAALRSATTARSWICCTRARTP